MSKAEIIMAAVCALSVIVMAVNQLVLADQLAQCYSDRAALQEGVE